MVTKRVKKPVKTPTVVTDSDKEMASAILMEARRIDEEREVPKNMENIFKTRRNIATYNLYRCRYMALSEGVRSEISRIAGLQNAKVNGGKPRAKKLTVVTKGEFQALADQCQEEQSANDKRSSFVEKGEEHD